MALPYRQPFWVFMYWSYDYSRPQAVPILWELIMTNSTPNIIYILTDEAPALVIYSLLLIANSVIQACEIIADTRDMSLPARIISSFPENLNEVIK